MQSDAVQVGNKPLECRFILLGALMKYGRVPLTVCLSAAHSLWYPQGLKDSSLGPFVEEFLKPFIGCTGPRRYSNSAFAFRIKLLKGNQL